MQWSDAALESWVRIECGFGMTMCSITVDETDDTALSFPSSAVVVHTDLVSSESSSVAPFAINFFPSMSSIGPVAEGSLPGGMGAFSLLVSDSPPLVEDNDIS